MTNKTTHIHFFEKLPHAKSFPKNSVVIFDEQVGKKAAIKKWLKTFPASYGVQAGESLKTLQSLETHVSNLQTLTTNLDSKEMVFIAIGGGSVGDFVGFLASIYHRGRPFIQIPSTWLAAIDSGHGGKNGLNVGRAKNQIGTFHFPMEVYLIKNLLKGQPTENLVSAQGEMFKIALLDGALWRSAQKVKNWTEDKTWEYLPAFINAKMKYVKKDPLETKGLRTHLNLGHTMGHVWEVEKNLPHGIAVANGVHFSLLLSRAQGLLSDYSYRNILKSPMASLIPSEDQIRKLCFLTKNLESLSKDKKRAGQDSLKFIFIKDVGQPVVRKVKIKDLEKWVKGLARDI